ncbi:gamma-glutamylcyclotransferase [Halalkalibacterium halodurans]|uniref:gamma-glutamylcyclotransferase family protein n=1 Tax=Halalkalibacterium halodurans TaxID=86665 RepID=UPI0002EEAC74|nr:gamma-glutamylcyclotransferase [Halalkalibacterium halodurans]MDY7222184.1 gamma-glutamylcyclotransferase [Halalkalibacterium halodurans]MDY7241405.1 gamma-glutamylcyclotransferase [Halalkalibacterium halodurans]MED3646750.1 gamma-glutamylcyclotransferase [Halalkalibacterium halodurans]MED4081815.1 gamma-glutamylcyclotransferase [Halalkalibacterium halodurans]MED4086448.1 gamma-glutamylcyclotransferase [Halalkalibacterium halodurans]
MLVFVYGTLRKGGANDHYLRGARCHNRRCYVYGHLYDSGLGYPALIADEKGGKVVGELYEINEQHLVSLDELEDYAPDRNHNLYERVLHTLEDGSHCYLYVVTPDSPLVRTLIPSGDWLDWTENKKSTE